MTKNNTNNQKASRKRRTFWDPSSEHVKTWLDNQKDLGVSLQLVITEAIQKYGSEDVISSYFEQKLHAGITQESSTTRNRIETPQGVELSGKPEGQENGQLDKQITSQSEPESESNSDEIEYGQDKQNVQDTTPSNISESVTLESVSHVGQVGQSDKNELDNQDLDLQVEQVNTTTPQVTEQVNPFVQEPVTPEIEAYDPVAVLLRDSGSQLAD